LRPIIMGCYGIGINRILASLIETNYDNNGILWPVALAPYEAVLVPVNVMEEQTRKVTGQMHDALASAGVEVLLDDRDQRAGVKFKDADLVGFPLRVVIGERGLKQGKLEIKWRWDEKSEMIALDGAVDAIAAMIRDERATGSRFKSRGTPKV
jgi:prolyl-tRNA synthetase